MKASHLAIPDLILFEPKIFSDERGFFFESFNQKIFEEVAGPGHSFIQDNHSKSSKGVLRGIHYQLPPKAQGKLMRVAYGEVYDVAVDIRKSSSTFGKWVGATLTSENKKQLWIPPGFAHGFVVLSEHAEILYKTTSYYAPEFERTIRWDDPDLSIQWPIDGSPILSEKDKKALPFKEIEGINL